ncbi:MAG: hypothetical protein WD491_15295 [Balneolales bacterium]
MITTKILRYNFIPAILGFLVFFSTGCDSGVDAVGDTESVTVSGQATENGSTQNNQRAGKTAESSEVLNSVEGAVVTAVAVHADGSVSTLEGETTTDANGEFTLTAEGEGAADYIRVFAQGDGEFETSSIVQVNGRETVNSPPLTAESHAHADIYLEAKSEDNSNSHYEGVTAADVSIFVNADLAADINARTESAADMGIAIANAVNAQIEYNTKAEAGIDMNAIADARSDAYARFQSDLAAATDAEARTEAYANLEESYINVFSENGANFETQAQFNQTFTSILIEASGEADGNAELNLRKQAELILSTTSALAIEEKFEAEGASEVTLDALAEARTEVVADIRQATSAKAIVDAKAEYKASVDAETESHFNISSEMRTTAEGEINSSINALQNALINLSLFTNNVAEATAEAFADFYLDAQVNAKTSFEASGMAEAEAGAAASIVVMVRAIVA